MESNGIRGRIQVSDATAELLRTSGKESYGGGRYVDCEIPEEGDVVLVDFNKAYNPYCAYNPRYSCVIPPEENRLEVRIEAGEKTFEEH